MGFTAMSVSHYCDDKWIDGTAARCDKHESNPNRPRVIVRDGGKADREAGVIGEDSGSGFYRDKSSG